MFLKTALESHKLELQAKKIRLVELNFTGRPGDRTIKERSIDRFSSIMSYTFKTHFHHLTSRAQTSSSGRMCPLCSELVGTCELFELKLNVTFGSSRNFIAKINELDQLSHQLLWCV